MIIKKLVGYANYKSHSSYVTDLALDGLIVGNHYQIFDDGTFINSNDCSRVAEVYLWADATIASSSLFDEQQCGAVTLPGSIKPSTITGTLTEDDGDHIQETLHTLPREPKPTEKGSRQNSGKTQFSYMLDANVAMKGMCTVFEFGAKKYARGNWKKGLVVNETIDSLLRHLIAYQNGEVLDLNEDGEADAGHSGLPHVDHITCNAVFLATFGDRDVKEEE